MLDRHEELVAEMLNRGYRHYSTYTMPDLSGYDLTGFKVDKQEALKDLLARCPQCKGRIHATT